MTDAALASLQTHERPNMLYASKLQVRDALYSAMCALSAILGTFKRSKVLLNAH